MANTTAAAQPRCWPTRDIWNSASTGHQRAETRPGAGWRESRNRKLNSQFRADSSSGERIGDTARPNAAAWTADNEVKTRKTGGPSVADMLVRPGIMQKTLLAAGAASVGIAGQPNARGDEASLRRDKGEEASLRGTFAGVVIYINGSTYPLISDYELKRIIIENGGQLSLHLERRRVTHVVLGRQTAGGGGLAGGKLDKEIKKMTGCGVKFVGVDWILDSLKAGKRLPEAGFSSTKIAPKGQSSVYGLFSKRAPSSGSKDSKGE